MTANDSSSILSQFRLTEKQHAATTAREAAISVTAGAGSGKTRTLVGRYLALLERGLPLRSLVAITFTDKAAREMRNRIRAVTTEWLRQNGTTPDSELWQEAFSALDAARISTIHGLCVAILRAHPAEAGLDPAFGVLEEGQSALWKARAVEEGLAWATADGDAARLFTLFQEGQLRRLLAGALEKRLDAAEILARLPERPLEVWSTILDRWLAEQLNCPAWSDSLETLAGVQAKQADDKLEIARREVLALWDEARQAHSDKDWDALFGTLGTLRGAISSGGQKGNWNADDLAAGREAMRALRAHFDEVINRLADKKKPPSWEIDRRTAELLPLIRRLFEQTQAVYQGYKSGARVLDFDDLEQMAAQLLTENHSVRARWQREIRAVLLVDEFQDTNHRQRKIVYALAGFEPNCEPGNESMAGPKEGWTEEKAEEQPSGSPAQSSFFIVGDAKQSIYRFRGADVAVFRQVQEDIRGAGGRLIDFEVTFRAHKALVELTNDLLSPLMPAQDDADRPYDVPFTALTAYRPEPHEKIQPPYLEFQIGLGEDKQSGRQAAAAALAGRLGELQRTNQIEWQDVALLFRASTAFPIYENALEQAGIPFVTIAGRGFYGRPEVRDLLNALSAIADPTDNLAMAGLLRSPAIGLSDGALHLLRWKDHQQHRSFWSALQNLAGIEGLSEMDRQQAEFARQLVARLHERIGRVTVAQLLKAFLDSTHYRAVLQLMPGGERLRRNVDKLLADAHRSELISVAKFLEYIAALGDVGARESEAPTEAGGAVQLMTIHKAKGLEFPVVVLADASYSGGSRPAPFHLDRDLGFVLNLAEDDAQSATFRLAACREAEQEVAEERRLLYVAATRAMEKFMISGDARLSTSKQHPGKVLPGGWLSQLAEVIGLGELQLPEMPAALQSVSMDWGNGFATCTIYPPATVEVSPTHPGEADPDETPADLPDLLAPGTVASMAGVDQEPGDRESAPPQRVWRVVPQSDYEVPAWVVGALAHVALRHWRFPEDPSAKLRTGPSAEFETDFVAFLRPFALEAGLVSPATIEIALNRVARLMTRFQAHPLYTQLSTAERHHELPYTLVVNGQSQSGIMDLLFRTTTESGWTIAEFKTDRLLKEANLRLHATQKGYDRQVAAYREAILQQMGVVPKALLVFLNAGQSVQVLSLD